MALPTTMRGAVIREQGADNGMTVNHDLPLPHIKDTEVLINIEYAGVNFIDVYQRTGVYPLKVPVTAGREGAGTIAQIGDKVPSEYGLKVGDKAAVFTQGAYAEYVAAAADSVMKLPENVSVKTGAAMMLQGLTAWTMTQDSHKVEKGQTVLVQAAAGGTGGLLVQMCKHLGATVIGTVSTEVKAKVAKEHGCDHIILYKSTDMTQEVMKLTDGKGCHAVFSGVGQATFLADLECTRRKGTLVTYGNSSGVVTEFKPLMLSKKNVKLVRPTLANYITERDEFLERSTELLKLLETGAVKVRVEKEYALQQVLEAQDDLSTQKTTGKLVLKI